MVSSEGIWYNKDWLDRENTGLVVLVKRFEQQTGLTFWGTYNIPNFDGGYHWSKDSTSTSSGDTKVAPKELVSW